MESVKLCAWPRSAVGTVDNPRKGPLLRGNVSLESELGWEIPIALLRTKHRTLVNSPFLEHSPILPTSVGQSHTSISISNKHYCEYCK